MTMSYTTTPASHCRSIVGGMEVLRYAAFTTDPLGGNPAGVVLDASGLADTQMQAIAADVGFSETAFVVARHDTDLEVRYFSPLAEVPFCGHATIAAAVADAHQSGPRTLHLTTRAGNVDVTTSAVDGVMTARLTTVRPRYSPARRQRPCRTACNPQLARVRSRSAVAASRRLRWRVAPDHRHELPKPVGQSRL